MGYKNRGQGGNGKNVTGIYSTAKMDAPNSRINPKDREGLRGAAGATPPERLNLNLTEAAIALLVGR